MGGECNCKNELKIYDEQIRNIKTDVRELDSRLRMNETKADVTASKLDTIIESIRRINNKLDEITKLPAKRWEKMIGVIITVIVTAILTYLIKG